jgi:transketolase
MRTACIDTLCKAAARDERIWLLCADLGYSVLEPFIESFPKRFINVGVAEQNMVGIAAGLAMAGRVVFTYSIVNFATFRCLEQIRNDVCYHNLPVKVVAVGGGFSYGAQGYTHHGLEDIAVTRVLPNMTVMAPADPWEARTATERLALSPGPAYLRLGRSNEPDLHSDGVSWPDHGPIVVQPGNDVLVIVSGPVLAEAIQAARRATARPVEIWSLPQIKPLPEAALAAASRRFGTIVTVEEGQIDGGMGSAVTEIIAGLPVRPRVIRRGVDGTILDRAWSQQSARKHYGLDADSLAGLLASLETH